MQLKKEEKYTFADYLTWGGEERYELIDGVPYLMSPAPTPRHQEVVAELIRQFGNCLRGKPCRVYPAPFDVRLNPEGADDTVVQPDVTVVCDPGKIDDRGCKGAPDLVIEVASPSTFRRDQITKLNRYRAAGVREYWIVLPEGRGAQVYLLEDGKYTAQAYTDADTVPVGVLEGCTIDLREVFPPEEQPPEEQPPEENAGP